jgi:hypothetical protein
LVGVVDVAAFVDGVDFAEGGAATAVVLQVFFRALVIFGHGEAHLAFCRLGSHGEEKNSLRFRFVEVLALTLAADVEYNGKQFTRHSTAMQEDAPKRSLYVPEKKRQRLEALLVELEGHHFLGCSREQALFHGKRLGKWRPGRTLYAIEDAAGCGHGPFLLTVALKLGGTTRSALSSLHRD